MVTINKDSTPYKRGFQHGQVLSFPFVFKRENSKEPLPSFQQYVWGYLDETIRSTWYAENYIAGYEAGMVAAQSN